MNRNNSLFIGVSEYDDPGIDDLPSSRNGAVYMHDQLTSGSLWKGDVCVGDVNERQLHHVVENFFRSLSGYSGVTMLYLCGHGACLKDGKRVSVTGRDSPDDFLLLSSESRQDDTIPSGLRFGEIIEMMRTYQLPTLVVIIDSCHAGAAAGVPLPTGQNILVLGACDYRNASLATKKERNGDLLSDFTYALLSLLDESSAGLDTGDITLTSLFSNAWNLMRVKPILLSSSNENPIIAHVKPILSAADCQHLVGPWDPDKTDALSPDLGKIDVLMGNESARLQIGAPFERAFRTADSTLDVFPWFEDKRFYQRVWDGSARAETTANRQAAWLKRLRKNGLLLACIRDDWRGLPNEETDKIDVDLYFALMARWRGSEDIDCSSEATLKRTIGRGFGRQQGYVKLSKRGRLLWRSLHA
jgi:hypothetical protein